MRGIIEIFCIPMKHSPLTILAIRLMTRWSVDERITTKSQGHLLHEVHHYDNPVASEESDHVEQVEL